MDEIIEYFVENYFTEEARDEIYVSFELFGNFDYKLAFEGFIDILTYTDDISSDDIKDKFVIELHDKLDYIFTEHLIVLNDDASITQKNELLKALYLIQHLEDTTPIIRMLESLESDEEKIATILSDLCELEKVDVMLLIESFESNLLDKLKYFVYNKEQSEYTEVVDVRDNITNLKVFFQEYGTANIGYALVSSEVMLGEDLSTYLQYVKDDVATADVKETAVNILSLLYMSKGGSNDTISLFREHSADILPNLNIISKVEVHIMQMINKVAEIATVNRTTQQAKQVIIPTGSNI